MTLRRLRVSVACAAVALSIGVAVTTAATDTAAAAATAAQSGSAPTSTSISAPSPQSYFDALSASEQAELLQLARAVGSAPVEPASNAAAATWSSWANADLAYYQSTPWDQIAAASGCSTPLVTYPTSTVGDAPSEIPTSVATPTVVVAFDCQSGENMSAVWGYAQAIVGTSSSGASASPAGFPVGGTCANITQGTACIEPGLTASYSITSGSSTGHVQLGNVGLSPPDCSSGGTVADSGTITLNVNGPYTGIGVTHQESVSSVWSSTWWEGPSGGPWNNYGSACSAI